MKSLFIQDFNFPNFKDTLTNKYSIDLEALKFDVILYLKDYLKKTLIF